MSATSPPPLASDHRLDSRHVVSSASSSSSAPHPSASSSQDNSGSINIDYNDHAVSLGHIRHRSIGNNHHSHSSSYIASTDDLNDSYSKDQYDEEDEDGVKDDRYYSTTTNNSSRSTTTTTTTTTGHSKERNNDSVHPSSSTMSPYPPISPRSGSYERLENGQGPNRHRGGSRVRIVGWRRSLVVCAFVVVVLFFFGRRTSEDEDGIASSIDVGSWIPGYGSGSGDEVIGMYIIFFFFPACILAMDYFLLILTNG
jgi:hypothetical protein